MGSADRNAAAEALAAAYGKITAAVGGLAGQFPVFGQLTWASSGRPDGMPS